MFTQITREDRDFYETNGYFIMPQFLSPMELSAWRQAMEISVAERKGKGLPGTDRYDRDQKGDYSRETFLQLINLWQDNPDMASCVLDNRMGQMICELAGLSQLRLWHDQALIKPAWGNPTAFHRDNPYWSFHHPQALSIWVALDDATRDNGCLYYVPGSHRVVDYRNSGIGQKLGDIFSVIPEYGGVRPVAAEIPAGGCLVHNGLTIHGAGANLTPFPRRAMTGQFMPPGAVFNGIQNVLSDEVFAGLKLGDSLEDDRRNPLLWNTAKETPQPARDGVLPPLFQPGVKEPTVRKETQPPERKITAAFTE